MPEEIRSTGPLPIPVTAKEARCLELSLLLKEASREIERNPGSSIFRCWLKKGCQQQRMSWSLSVALVNRKLSAVGSEVLTQKKSGLTHSELDLLLLPVVSGATA